ncbi:hypothetical protein BDZ94DRAFT_152744 [Collybia nuda]|uniref:Uncharacterized protein n=1 Tax=Collybia nuda TaxID=64659 RepID=A0A9P5XVX8_9AGAR|nr:hypothetical protein BDZ94DRAFT_152744 [Collybia nuda]
MSSHSRTTPSGHRPPPFIPKWNPNQPRKNGPGNTPYYTDPADLPPLDEDSSDEEISDAFTRMGIKGQQNPAPQGQPRLYGPLDRGSSTPRQAMPIHNTSFQPQQSTIARSHSATYPFPPRSPPNGRYGYPDNGTATFTSHHTPTMRIPQNQTAIYNQAPNSYTNSPRNPRCTTPTKQELVMYTHKTRTPARRNSSPTSGLTENQIAYHSNQYDPNLKPSHTLSVPSRSSSCYRLMSGRLRSSSVVPGVSYTSSPYGPHVAVPYGYPATLYPDVEYPSESIQYAPPQANVVHSHTVQISQTTGYHATTYTEHQQIIAPPPFY